MKCWNSSYSYTSDGKNSSETFQKSFNDGHRIYEDGYIKTQDKDLNEKFYKKEKQLKNNSEKSLLGKSKNRDDWELLRIKNGHKTYKKQKYNDGTKKLNEYNKYLERPSSRHRLTRHSNESLNQVKINEVKEFNPDNILNNMFQELNLSMFDNDDFFKF